jgi:hypothetical protein
MFFIRNFLKFGGGNVKVSLSCIQCKTSEGHKAYEFELRDNNTYLITCEQGHESIIFFESHKFELLFEMGIYAVMDGYFREVVSNFAASIERFHEFSIEVFSQYLFRNVNSETSNLLIQQEITNEYDKTWKMISNQSERQLGAYTMLYLSTFKYAPELIKNKHIEFRNKVIHKGYFPTEKETIEYAVDIFNYLQLKLIELKDYMDDYVTYVYERKMRDYISNEDVNGKHIVNWAELMTFRTLRPIDEIKALDFNTIVNMRKTGYKSFKS